MSTNSIELIALADQLEAFISDAVPGAERVNKYGGTLFTLKPEAKEGQFCGVFVLKQHVQISFSQGALLQDPQCLLQGSGKHRRHVNFTSADEVDFSYIKTLLVQSLKL